MIFITFSTGNIFVLCDIFFVSYSPSRCFNHRRIGSFILSIFLTHCFWIPGVIYSILVTNNYYLEFPLFPIPPAA
ncbi:YqaE/Pmp3 family membrane protein, partial [Mucilaginibacter sp.]